MTSSQLDRPDSAPSPRAPSFWIPLLAWCAASLLAIGAAHGWPVENRLSIWVAEMSRDEGYGILLDHFGGDEVVILRIDRVDAEDPDVRLWILGLEPRLRSEAAILAVVHPLTAPLGGAAALAFDLGEVARRPLVRNLDLVRPGIPAEARSARIDVLAQVRTDASLVARSALARTFEDLKREGQALSLRVRASGHPLVADALDQESQRIKYLFAPALVLLATLGTALLLRSMRLAIAAVLPAVLAFAGAWTALRWAGFEANFVLLGSGPIAFVVVLASTLHLVMVFRRHLARGVERPLAARAALREKLLAGCLAALTTAAGFAVFVFSDIGSVATLGLTISALVATLVPLAMIALCPLLARLPTSVPRVRRAPPRRRRVALIAVKQRRWVIAVSVVLLALGVPAGMSLERETNPLRYFPEGYAMREDFLSIEEEGGALSFAEVLVRNPGTEPWAVTSPMFARIGQALAGIEGVVSVFGPDSMLEDTRKQLGVMAFEPVRALALTNSMRWDAAHHWARWTVRFPTLGDTDSESVVASARSAAMELLPEAEVHVTGTIPALLDMQGHLVDTLALSLACTLAVTTLLLLVVVRSLRDAAAALIVNGLPVAIVLETAYLLDLTLDGGTVLVTAVVLGMAVDATFHALHATPRRSNLRTRLRAHEHVAEATGVSTLAVALGFLCLAFSGFQPVARFGVLCALGLTSALCAYVVVWPALWVRVSRPAARPNA